MDIFEKWFESRSDEILVTVVGKYLAENLDKVKKIKSSPKYPELLERMILDLYWRYVFWGSTNFEKIYKILLKEREKLK